MANLHGFDANNVEPSKGFDPLPAGHYSAVITSSEMKQTKLGNGSYLQLTFEVVEGQYGGRRLWVRLNLDNPTPQTVAIAKAELSAICRAVNVMRPQDSSELHNLPLQVTVACRKRRDTGEIVNEITGYERLDSPPPAGSAVANGTAPSAPWLRSGQVA